MITSVKPTASREVEKWTDSVNEEEGTHGARRIKDDSWKFCTKKTGRMTVI